MKGDPKMTFNPFYADLIGRELIKSRMQEAEQERLIKQAAGWDPGLAGKLLIILQARWNKFWPRLSRRKEFIPLSQVPRKSTSL